MTLRHLRGEVKHIDQNQAESDQQNYPGGNNVLTQKIVSFLNIGISNQNRLDSLHFFSFKPLRSRKDNYGKLTLFFVWKIPLICFSILPNLTGGTKKETQLIMTNIADGR